MDTLSNSFHNTYIRVRNAERFEAIMARPAWERTETEHHQVRRVWRALCGQKDCTCGDEAGRRR